METLWKTHGFDYTKQNKKYDPSTEVMCIDPKATMKDKHIEGGYLILKWYCICEQTIKIYDWKPPERLIIPKNKMKQNKKYI